jgi:beta-glucosidase
MYFKGQPLFAFGYGLSYSTFEYSNLRLSSKQVHRDGKVMVRFEIKNTSTRAGDEVAQLYVRYRKPSVQRPKQELVGFKRIPLTPGEKKLVEIPLNLNSFSYWNVERHQFEVEPGMVELMVGSSSASIRFSDTLLMEK